METNKKEHIDSKDQIKKMVDYFYDKVKSDALIGPIFNDTAKVNWEEHLPKLNHFWEDLLLGTNQYHGRPFPPHIPLNLKIEHFERWLLLFLYYR